MKFVATSLSISLRLALSERKYRTHFVTDEHFKTSPKSIFNPKNRHIQRENTRYTSQHAGTPFQASQKEPAGSLRGTIYKSPR